MLDHILRIDRVLRQPLGHVLLLGASGAGKTVMTRFIAWLNGLSIFQVAIPKNGMIQNAIQHHLRLHFLSHYCINCRIFARSSVHDCL